MLHINLVIFPHKYSKGWTLRIGLRQPTFRYTIGLDKNKSPTAVLERQIENVAFAQGFRYIDQAIPDHDP